MCARARPVLDGIRAPAPKFLFRRARPSASNRARNCSRLTSCSRWQRAEVRLQKLTIAMASLPRNLTSSPLTSGSYVRTRIPFSDRPRMGAAAAARRLGHPTAEAALVDLCAVFCADDVQHNGRRRAHADQLPAPTTGIFAE